MTKTTERITIEVDKTLKKQVVLHCAEKEISVKEFITQVIKDKLK